MPNREYFKSRISKLYIDVARTTSVRDSALFELYQNYLQLKNAKCSFNIEKAKTDFMDYILTLDPTDRLSHIVDDINPYIWGMVVNSTVCDKILYAVSKNREVYFCEDAFLRCIIGTSQKLADEFKHYQLACGYIIDDLAAYFDATRPSRMELILNSDFELTQEQIKRAKKNINRLIKTKISKYNNQPIFKPDFGIKGTKKILVIDQSYGDFSISKGLADDNTFKVMLDCAIKENPDADILIKTHPDAIGKDSAKPVCYYQSVKEKGNVYKITQPINPISMIEYVDKVYVCSSQFGFEALMCNKEVHTFGMPFYAGWGLTVDNQKCERRTRKRTLEEIFYIAYIYMATYINPKTNKPCEIEEAIDYLIEYRDKYFKENNIRYEI